MLEISTAPSWWTPTQETHPSSHFAQCFKGVSMADDVAHDLRRANVNFFIEAYNLLYRTGEFDHTGDWDFHIGLETIDNRANTHIGDGADIEWGPNDTVLITGPLYDEPLEEGGKSDLELDPFAQYREKSGHADSDEYTWTIPCAIIRSLAFGYCT